MSKFLSGIDGALYCDGAKVGRVSSWRFSGVVAPLETTTLADAAKTYASGIQSYSGNCNVYCYENDAGELQASALMGDVLRTTAAPYDRKHRLKLSVGGQVKERTIECNVVITSVQLGASAGDVVEAEVSFVVTGSLVGNGMGVI